MKIQFRKILLSSLCLSTCSLFMFFSCRKQEWQPRKAEAVITATAPATTAVSGRLTFTEQKNKTVKMELEVVVPSRAGQSVAVHLHEHGDCSNNGNNAHGHWNPTGKPHGKWGEGQFHAGDIGNISLDGTGKGSLTITTDLWTIGGSDQTNIIGRGVIVHGGTDDYTSQPAGNSGPRIGCGAVLTAE